MKRVGITVAICCFFITAALGQSVQQSGSVTRNHLPYWVGNGLIGDAGTSADSPLASMGVTNANQSGICANSARAATGAWQSLCLGFLGGIPTVTVQNNGSAPATALQFVVDGIVFPFPSSLSQITVGVTPIASGTSNGILYNNLGVLGNLPTAANSVMVTSAGSVPGLSTTLPSGLTIPSPIFTGSNFLTLAMLPQINALSLWGNPTGVAANATQLTLDPTLNFSGTSVKCTTATNSQNGCARPDGTTITVNAGGQLTAIGAATTSIDAGGLTSITNGKANDYLYQNGSNVGHSGFIYGAFAASAGAL